MSELHERREFLKIGWMAGAGLIGVAGAWTTWDVLQPVDSAGFGGEVRTIPEDSVPEEGVLAVPAARSYLTKIGGEVVAVSETCPHLGCRVPWCDSSGQFECPCHGSTFNRKGEAREGPSPRAMSLYPVEIVDGLVIVNTGEPIEGAPIGEPETIDEPKRGPSCEEGGHGA
jgi:cytochrome b6-f complex iron-sulfur subunit